MKQARQNWASNVRVVLNTYGFGYVWLSQDIGDIGLFISQFKVRLIDCMSQSGIQILLILHAVIHIESSSHN